MIEVLVLLTPLIVWLLCGYLSVVILTWDGSLPIGGCVIAVMLGPLTLLFMLLELASQSRPYKFCVRRGLIRKEYYDQT